MELEVKTEFVCCSISEEEVDSYVLRVGINASEEKDPLKIIKREIKDEIVKEEEEIVIDNCLHQELDEGNKHTSAVLPNYKLCVSCIQTKNIPIDSMNMKMLRSLCTQCDETAVKSSKSQPIIELNELHETCDSCMKHVCNCMSLYCCANCNVILDRYDDIICHLGVCGSKNGLSDKPRVENCDAVILRNNYFCKYCNKSFNWQHKLNTHLRVHTGYKPFSCLHCKKSFNDRSNLNRHLLIHFGAMPYTCKECKKSFNQKCILDRHLLCHSGKRPYTCNVCERSFNRKGTLDRHIRFLHSGNG